MVNVHRYTSSVLITLKAVFNPLMLVLNLSLDASLYKKCWRLMHSISHKCVPKPKSVWYIFVLLTIGLICFCFIINHHFIYEARLIYPYCFQLFQWHSIRRAVYSDESAGSGQHIAQQILNWNNFLPYWTPQVTQTFVQAIVVSPRGKSVNRPGTGVWFSMRWIKDMEI